MKRHQAGWTLWGMALVMGLVAFFALLAIKLLPAYFDNFKIRQSLEGLAREPGVAAMGRQEIITALDKRMYIDYVDRTVDLRQALIIEKTKEGMKLRVAYQRVIPLAYNISALLDFDEQVTVGLR